MSIRKVIEETIIQLGQKYAAENGIETLEGINHGNCEDFRDMVIQHLEKQFPHEFFEPICIRDLEGVEEMPATFADLLEMPYHAWFIYDGLHYDVEVPRGVENLFDLPFFQYYLNLSENERSEVFQKLNEITEERNAFMAG